jgi:hypothetical protein
LTNTSATEIDEYQSLINSPTADKPFNRNYTIDYLGNVIEGKRINHLNLPMERIKELIWPSSRMAPVWFGSDVGFYRDRQGFAWDSHSLLITFRALASISSSTKGDARLWPFGDEPRDGHHRRQSCQGCPDRLEDREFLGRRQWDEWLLRHEPRTSSTPSSIRRWCSKNTSAKRSLPPPRPIRFTFIPGTRWAPWRTEIPLIANPSATARVFLLAQQNEPFHPLLGVEEIGL